MVRVENIKWFRVESVLSVIRTKNYVVLVRTRCLYSSTYSYIVVLYTRTVLYRRDGLACQIIWQMPVFTTHIILHERPKDTPVP